MEQPALRPRPMPGDGGGQSSRPASARPPVRPARQHAGRRVGRRLVSAVLGTLTGVALVLSGVGLGAVGATLAGTGALAELKRQAGTAPVSGPSASGPRGTPSAPARAPVVARLGVEVADGRRPGARVVAVHMPGPGSSAGLVPGDVLLAFDGRRVDSAADLARAVARARPGDEVTLTVRHRGGDRRRLTAVPGIVT